MKHTITFLFGILLFGNGLLSSAQQIPIKNCFGQEIIRSDGKKLNYSKSELKPQKSKFIPEKIQLRNLEAVSGTIQTAMNATIQPLYSMMGSSIGRTSMHSVDMDKDGNMELICTGSSSTFGGSDYWYVMRYDNTDKTWNQIWVSSLGTSNITALEIIDYDQDGDNDVLVGFNNGTLEIYDATTLNLTKTIKPVSESINSIAFADANNDSRMELVLAGSSNTKLIDPQTFEIRFTINQGANAVRIGQMDDSGFNEIVLSSGSIYKLNSNDLTTVWTFSSSNENLMEISDIDKDSRKELIVTQSWNKLFVYDVETKTAKYTIVPDRSIQALTVTDVDNDGVEDILYGDDQWGNVYAHNGLNGSLLWTIANPEHGVSNINFADVNNDGAKELIWGAGWTSTGSDYLYIYDTSKSSLLWRSEDVRGPFNAISTGDVDEDGQDEIVAVSLNSESEYESGVLIILNAQTNKVKWISNGSFFENAWEDVYNVSIGDVNNDGKNEIVVAADYLYTGQIWIVDGKTHTIKSSHRFSSENIGALHSLAIEDVDKDGQMELLTASYSELLVINPVNWAIEWRVNLNSSYSIPVIRSADVNGDGNMDIVLCNGNIQIIQCSDQTNWTSPETNYTNIDLFDFNNDNVPDIVASTSNGHIVVLDGKTKVILSDIAPETSNITSVRAYKSDQTLYYIYSCNGALHFYQNGTNCGVTNYLGSNVGANESLKLYNPQSGTCDLLIGSSISVSRMTWKVLTTSTDTLNLAAENGSQQNFEINTSGNWDITNTTSWLTVSPLTGTGNATIMVTAQKNNIAELRMAAITISGTESNSKLLTVVQKADKPFMTLSADTVSIGNLNQSTANLSLLCNMKWKATSSADWLYLSPSNGLGNDTIRLTADENRTTSVKTAVVTIAGTGIDDQKLVVCQKPGPFRLEVPNDTVFINGEANSRSSFYLNSNSDWKVTCPDSWLVLNKTNGSNASTIYLTALKNKGIHTRTTVATFTCDTLVKKVTIKQRICSPLLYVAEDSLTIHSSSDTVSFRLYSDINWQISSNASWLTVRSKIGNGNAKVVLTAIPNYCTEIRSTTIRLKGDEVEPIIMTVIQEVFCKIDESGDSILSVSPNPATNEIILKDLGPQATVGIFNMDGKLLMTSTGTIRLDVSSLPQGIYLIRETDAVTTKRCRFIKK